jgi:toxin HigB-1
MAMTPVILPLSGSTQNHALQNPRVNIAGIRRADLLVVLAALATAAVPSDMALPGARLHPLRGDRTGQWSVSISGNWRVIFEFEGHHVTNVDFLDYH